MQITDKKVAAISYKLSSTNSNGEKSLLETVDEKHPMFFLVGHSGLPEKFEQQLEGLKKGDKFDFHLSAAEAFGEQIQDDVINLPISDFLGEDGKFDTKEFGVGKRIPMTDENEEQVIGTIIEINEAKEYIKMDFNHPLAGHNLHFSGKVELVRDAKPEEMSHGHVHGDGGHHH